jgi:hypothetical protein
MGELQKIADYQKQLQKLCDTDSTVCHVFRRVVFVSGALTSRVLRRMPPRRLSSCTAWRNAR